MQSVRARLMWFNVLILAISFGIIGLGLQFWIRVDLMKDLDLRLAASIDAKSTTEGFFNKEFEKSWKPQVSTSVVDSASQIVRRDVNQVDHGPPHVVEMVRSERGQVRLDADPNIPRLFPVPFPSSSVLPQPIYPRGYERAASGHRVTKSLTWQGQRLRCLYVPIWNGQRVVAVAQASESLKPLDEEIGVSNLALAAIAPLAMLLAYGAGALVVQLTLAPLRQMISAASGLSEDFSDGLLPVRGKDEFADLAEALNVSLGRSRDAFRRQQAVIAQLERFTADASHELKTPLASVKTGASYLVHLGELGPKDREIAEQVDRSADRMSQLIADLITLAKLDSGSSSDRIGRVGLAEVVAQGWPETVRVDVDPDLEVLGDKAALERVFANLIGNAVAYCRTEVVVSASRVGDRVMVEVRDDGAGIAPEHLARLGERFYRPDDARSRAEGGTGLGLAIAKSLVLAQGGRLRIESEVGVGTRVVVELVSG